MRSTHINGTKLAYIEHGQGDPIIFVHGTLGDYRSWELQINAFAEKFHTISYSRRYHYPNQCDGNESDYTARLHADDLAEFMASFGIESAHIIGNSYGAYTGLFLAFRHPERAQTLVLSEPPVFPLLDNNAEGRKHRNDFLEKVWEPAGKILEQGEMEKGVRKFVDGVVSDGAFDQFPQKVKNLIMDNACEFKTETLSPDFWTPFTCKEAKKITTPTLLLNGDKSVRLFQLIADELTDCLPDNESVRIPDSTHELPADNPEAYNRIVMDFLEKHSGHAVNE